MVQQHLYDKQMLEEYHYHFQSIHREMRSEDQNHKLI